MKNHRRNRGLATSQTVNKMDFICASVNTHYLIVVVYYCNLYTDAIYINNNNTDKALKKTPNIKLHFYKLSRVNRQW